jgi:pyruvate formate lyase activating enzyme
MEIILRDESYFLTSGGGVTFSGGEPLIHMDYLETLMIRLKEKRIRTAVETCGFFNYLEFRERILPLTDIVLFDIKLINAEDHKLFTGRDNERILYNFVRLANEEDVFLFPRVPLIPGITTTDENLSAVAGLFQDMNISEYELLSYNPSGAGGKWERLGKQLPRGIPQAPLSLEEEMLINEKFSSMMCVELTPPAPLS